MTKCDYCNKEISRMPYKCKYCGGRFCSDHRLPENHDCSSVNKNKKWFTEKKAKKEISASEIASEPAAETIKERGLNWSLENILKDKKKLAAVALIVLLFFSVLGLALAGII